MKIQAVLLWLACCTYLTSASAVQTREFRSGRLSSVSVSGLDKDEDTDWQAKPDSEEEKKKSSWSAKMEVPTIPVDIALLIAAVWVITLGSAPIFLNKVGDKKVTNSAIILSCSMWLALFGGIYLFTNVIVFKSGHFEKVRTLTVIECTYFMTQVITTVGYGDIIPAHPRGEVFVGLYVVFAFFVIALLMSEMQAVVVARVAKYKDKLKHTAAEKLRGRTGTAWLAGHPEDSTPSRSTNLIGLKPEKPSVLDLIYSVCFFVFIAVVWILFFVFYPGEEKPWLEACYMALITLTTVGFGAVTPSTEGGMLFGAFFMFIGTSALVNVVGCFSTFIMEMDHWETWSAKQFEKDLKKFGKSLEEGSEIPEGKFLAFALVQKNIVTQEQIDAIMDTYTSMRANTGVSTKDILESIGPLETFRRNDTSDSVGGSARSSPPQSPEAAAVDPQP